MASIQVDKGEEYQFLFDNTSSFFAGKAVSFRYSWSSQPIYPVMPDFGEFKNEAGCKQLTAQLSKEGISIQTLLNLAFAAVTGDWFSAVLAVLELYMSTTQADSVISSGLDGATYAMFLWACGIQP